MPGTSAFIIGDAEGLTALRAAIDAALKQEVAVAYAGGVDGERYGVVVCRHPLPGAELALPYSDPAFAERDEAKTKPWDFAPIVRALSRR
jgi:hypothetical protein